MLDDKPGQDAENETDCGVQSRDAPEVIEIIPHHCFSGIRRMKKEKRCRKENRKEHNFSHKPHRPERLRMVNTRCSNPFIVLTSLASQFIRGVQGGYFVTLGKGGIIEHRVQKVIESPTQA